MSPSSGPGLAPASPPARFGPAREADLEAIASMARDALPGGPDTEGLRSALDSRAGRLFVARRGAVPVAFVLAFRAADVLEIGWIAVVPGERRRGLGRGLLSALVRADSRGRTPLEAVQLEVRAGNEEARAFYQALGFVAVGRRERYYRGGEDAILMTRTS